MGKYSTSGTSGLVRERDSWPGQATYKLQRSSKCSSPTLYQASFIDLESINCSDLEKRESFDDQSIRISARFDRIDEQTKRIISVLLENSNVDCGYGFYSEGGSQIVEITRTLTQLVGRLEILNQDNLRHSRNLALKCSCNYDEEIVADVEMLEVSHTEELKLRKAIQTKILMDLRYPEITSRYDDIAEAHPSTFEWAFSDLTRESRFWSGFAAWLKSKESRGVYWISGKAGSGKSTLMKHIFDDPRTKQYLEAWAAETPLCVASFFFWNSGVPIQKSQLGLFRALLFQILHQQPDLIPIVFPDLWARRYSRSLRPKSGPEVPGHAEELEPQTWSLRQLMRSFKSLVEQRSLPLKLWLLIDGLDEFDGDHEVISDLFKDATISHNTKVCLSSRPWVLFEDAFCIFPCLQLQNLTQLDIKLYVSDKFSHSGAFRRLEAREPELASTLIHEVIESANGVFLWVRLVVKSLLDGIRNHDDVQILQSRLRTLPKELEPLYKHLLNHIEPVYWQWVSKSFQMVRAARLVGAPLRNVTKGQRGNGLLTLEAFYFAIKEDNEIETVQRTAANGIGAEIQNLAVQLTARCAGMLEFSNRNHSETISAESTIVYLHGTAREFLDKESNWQELFASTADEDFNPFVSLMKAQLLILELYWENSVFPGTMSQFNKPMISQFMIYAFHADGYAQKRSTQRALLACLDQRIANKCSRMDQRITKKLASFDQSLQHWSNNMVDHYPDELRLSSFLDFATLHNVKGYVGEKLEVQGSSLRRATASSLLYQLLPYHSTRYNHDFPLPMTEMVSLLLLFGADPNWSPQNGSVWQNVLIYTLSSKCLTSSYVCIMETLILAGANPQAGVYEKGVFISAMEIVAGKLMRSLPLDAARLLKKLKELITDEEPRNKLR
jgi:hypothetical protein